MLRVIFQFGHFPLYINYSAGINLRKYIYFLISLGILLLHFTLTLSFSHLNFDILYFSFHEVFTLIYALLFSSKFQGVPNIFTFDKWIENITVFLAKQKRHGV